MSRGFQSYIDHMNSWGVNVIIEDGEIVEDEQDSDLETSEDSQN